MSLIWSDGPYGKCSGPSHSMYQNLMSSCVDVCEIRGSQSLEGLDCTCSSEVDIVPSINIQKKIQKNVIKCVLTFEREWLYTCKAC